jgi:hypothetical protein
MEKFFNVKFKYGIYKEIQRQIEEEGRSAIIPDDRYCQVYNPRFLEPIYFRVTDDSIVKHAYRIREPISLRGYYINKAHVIPSDTLQLDDSLFEW